jgi:hypothetical protein
MPARRSPEVCRWPARRDPPVLDRVEVVEVVERVEGVERVERVEVGRYSAASSAS